MSKWHLFVRIRWLSLRLLLVARNHFVDFKLRYHCLLTLDIRLSRVDLSWEPVFWTLLRHCFSLLPFLTIFPAHAAHWGWLSNQPLHEVGLRFCVVADFLITKHLLRPIYLLIRERFSQGCCLFLHGTMSFGNLALINSSSG